MSTPSEQSSDPTRVLRSQNADSPSCTVFASRVRDRNVAVHWIDYNGQQVRYAVLVYSQQFRIYTYLTHPWVFLDETSGDELVVSGGQKVFLPQEWDGDEEHIQTVFIYTPVYSLRERCMQVVRKTSTLDIIARLNLPQSLKRDLLRGFTPSAFRLAPSFE